VEATSTATLHSAAAACSGSVGVALHSAAAARSGSVGADPSSSCRWASRSPVELGWAGYDSSAPIAQFFKIVQKFKPKNLSKNWDEPRLELKTDNYNVRKSQHCAICKFIYKC
jgi:hypothetical protein